MKPTFLSVPTSIFVTVYLFINGYIFYHGWNVRGSFGLNSLLFIILFCFLSVAFVIGKHMERFKSTLIADSLIFYGALWFVGIAHFLIICMAYDVFLFWNSFFHWVSYDTLFWGNHIITLIALIATMCVLLGGFINTRFPIVRRYQICIDKPNLVTNRLRIAVASDIHLGYMYGARFAEKIVKKINALHPDIIFIPGDIIDGDIRPVVRKSAGAPLMKFDSTYGTFGVLGNHDYEAGVEAVRSYVAPLGITILQDLSLEVAGVVIIGRDDYGYNSHTKNPRKSIDELMHDVDTKKPIICIDHQPRELDHAEKAGVDIQFSGHTHNGQLWPLNMLVKRVFEIAFGYKKIGNTHFFVSAWTGTGKPPVRTNARPDILLVEVDFNW